MEVAGNSVATTSGITAINAITGIEAAPFIFTSRERLARGVLLRVGFAANGGSGFGLAELMPWPSLGDPELASLVASLVDNLRPITDQTERSHRLIDRALSMAYVDFNARACDEDLLPAAVENHYLYADSMPIAPGEWLELRREGFRAVKVKVRNQHEIGSTFSPVLSWLGDIRIRLDMNGGAQPEELASYLSNLPIRLRLSIELIEDPFPFEPEIWREFQIASGIPLWLDRLGDGLSVEEKIELFRAGAIGGCVHKPGWDSDESARAIAEAGVPIMVTSLMGHPIGQLHAARVAAQLAPNLIHGCFSHVIYEANPAFRILNTAGPNLLPYANNRATAADRLNAALKPLRWERLR